MAYSKAKLKSNI